MTIHRRLSLSAALAVALAVALCSVACYVAVRAKLRNEVDTSLRRAADVFEQVPPPGAKQTFSVRAKGPGPPLLDKVAVAGTAQDKLAGTAQEKVTVRGKRIVRAGFGRVPGEVQILNDTGAILFREQGGQRLPVDGTTRAVAKGRRGQLLIDRQIDGMHARLLVVPMPKGGAVQVARSLQEVDSVLRALLFILIGITVVGVGIAAALGGLVSRAALGPVRRFTKRTESIAGAPDLSQRLNVEHDDELGRMAASFNTTLDALERSVAAQRQLVADASHELRTPLASLRTNLEVISGDKPLPPEERRELLADLIDQADELNLLVADVVELARRGEPDEAADDVALDEVVAAAVRRAERHRPEVRFETDLRPTTVVGVARRLDRAAANLLDNAAKWSPPGAVVEVSLRDGVLSVRDHGPGFERGDLPYVFDRFHRAASARSLPGSGLGLAIVRQVAESHGASVEAANAPGGGAVLTLTFAVAQTNGSSPPLTEIFGSVQNTPV